MLKQQLKKYFGFDSFLAGQETVIRRVLERKSAAAIFPTGAGKSLCYQLPAMLLPNMTLVVSPLLSLMKDQLDFLQAKKIPAARLDSTLERAAYNAIIEAARKGSLKVLMVSVERFKNERFRSHLEKMDVSLLVIDEAHCISEWGHNFRPEYLNLPSYQKAFGIEQTLLLTATATAQVIDDMCAKFNLARENVFVTGFYRNNLFLQVSPTATSEKEDRLLRRILENQQAPTIVYVTLQKTAERVAAFLCRHGIDARPYHAGMQSGEREQIQSQFMQGNLACIVATIAFGMGIDKKDIRRVIHFDLPKSIENYSQEIGRSGRDGDPALCEVLANRDTIPVLENFIYGETLDFDNCGHCSFCKNGPAVLECTAPLTPLTAYDYTSITEAFIQASGDASSVLNVTKFLCGIYTPAFSRLKIKSLPHFGMLAQYPFLEVVQWVSNSKH